MMRKLLNNDEFSNILEKESDVYKCPICKKYDWAIFSKQKMDDNRFGTFAYPPYIISEDGISLALETSSITFALTVCRNCGFIATFEEDILIEKLEKLNKNNKGKNENGE